MNMAIFKKVKLGDIFRLEYGKGLIAEKRVAGDFPVYGSSGQVGTHVGYLIKGPGIVVGRKGSVGKFIFQKIIFIRSTQHTISKMIQRNIISDFSIIS